YRCHGLLQCHFATLRQGGLKGISAKLYRYLCSNAIKFMLIGGQDKSPESLQEGLRGAQQTRRLLRLTERRHGAGDNGQTPGHFPFVVHVTGDLQRASSGLNRTDVIASVLR